MILDHYTDRAGLDGILRSSSLNPSTASRNPQDVQYGDGQYFSDVVPGSLSPLQLSRLFLGFPFQDRRYTHYVAVNVEGLSWIEGRPGVFVVPNDRPLDLVGRIVGSGGVVDPNDI